LYEYYEGNGTEDELVIDFTKQNLEKHFDVIEEIFDECFCNTQGGQVAKNFWLNGRTRV
jgi:hypothetical protein